MISDSQDCNHCLQNPKYTSPGCVRAKEKSVKILFHFLVETEIQMRMKRGRSRCASERAGCAALSSFFRLVVPISTTTLFSSRYVTSMKNVKNWSSIISDVDDFHVLNLRDHEEKRRRGVESKCNKKLILKMIAI